MRLNISAFEELASQNYLIEILHWLTLQVRSTQELIIYYDSIRDLLDAELKKGSKKALKSIFVKLRPEKVQAKIAG
jgi:hypothetical protein